MTIWFVWYLPASCPLAGVFSTEKKAIEYIAKMIDLGYGNRYNWTHGTGTIDVPLIPLINPQQS